jgi:hypothetical protein
VKRSQTTETLDRTTPRQAANPHPLHRAFENHIEPKFGKTAIATLSAATVRGWYAATLIDKPTMRAHAYGLLKSICESAVKDDLLDRNPCKPVPPCTVFSCVAPDGAKSVWGKAVRASHAAGSVEELNHFGQFAAQRPAARSIPYAASMGSSSVGVAP